MKKYAVVLALALVPGPGAHASHTPIGMLCGMTGSNDPQVTRAYGVTMAGGPVLLSDRLDPVKLYQGALTCSVQVNNAVHGGPDACGITGAGANSVVTVSGHCMFTAVSGDNIYLCSEVTFADGYTLYFDQADTSTRPGRWSTDPDSRCALTTAITMCVVAEPCSASHYDATLLYYLPDANVPVPAPVR